MSKISGFETEYFEVDGAQIEEWNRAKIPLSEGAGAKFIAPKNLVVRLKEPFYYDWEYETDGRIDRREPTLVYGKDWVGKNIEHFPYCKELLEINEKLKQYGWRIPVSWSPIVDALRAQLVEEEKMDDISREELSIALQNRLLLTRGGRVWEGDLTRVSKFGHYWPASREFADGAFALWFSSDNVCLDYDVIGCCALSVRCVSNL